MANKSLNDRYDIPFGSEWEHKDGGLYSPFGKAYKCW